MVFRLTLLLLLLSRGSAASTAFLIDLLELKPKAKTEFLKQSKEEQEKTFSLLVAFGTGDAEAAKDPAFARYLPSRVGRVLNFFPEQEDLYLPFVHETLRNSEGKRALLILELVRELHRPDSREKIVEKLLSFPGEETEGALLSALHYFGGSDSLSSLKRYRAKRTVLSEPLVERYFSALGDTEADEAVELIEKELTHGGSDALRSHAMKVLSEMSREKSVNVWLPAVLASTPGSKLGQDRENILKEAIPKLSKSMEPGLFRKILREILAAEKKNPKSELVPQVLGKIASLGKSSSPLHGEVASLLQMHGGRWDDPTLSALAAMKSEESDKALLQYLSSPLDLPKPPVVWGTSDLLYNRAKAAGGTVERHPEVTGILAKQFTDAFLLYGPAEFEKLKDGQDGSREILLSLYESARRMIPEEGDRLKLDEAIIRGVFPEPEKPHDPCVFLCDLAARTADWAKKDWINKPEYWQAGYPASPWRFAIAGVAATFLAKAAPLCPAAKDLWTQLAAAWFPPGTGKTTNESPLVKEGTKPVPIRSIAKLAANVRSMTDKAPLGDKFSVYGKMFYYSVLKELEAQNGSLFPKGTLDWEKIQDEAALTRASLDKDMGLDPVPTSGVAGSLFETFVLAASHLTNPNPPAQNKKTLLHILDLALKAHPELPPVKAAQLLPYGPEHPAKENRRSAAARVVPFHFALYKTEKDTKQRGVYRQYLLEALRVYSENTGSLMLHIFRNNTHKITQGSEYDGLAPYYYYPATAYVGAAIRQLQLDPALTDDEKDELKRFKEHTRRKLMLLIQKDGLFLPQGSDRYESSPAYVNPLAGMALLALSEDCGGGDSILPKVTVEKKPAPAVSVTPDNLPH